MFCLPHRFPGHSTIAAIVRIWLMIAVCAITANRLEAGQWPQILGPNRNAVAVGEQIAPWQGARIPRVWSHAVGEGYAGPAVDQGKVVVFHRQADAEVVETLAADTGTVLWKCEFPANYGGGIDPDRGPRCVPIIHGDKIFAFGAAGNLHAISLSDGKHLWSRRLLHDYSGLEGYFGVGSTPIVVGDRLLINLGGRENAGIIAISARDGTTLWKGTSERASYASPIAAEISGRRRAIFVTRLNTIVVDPASGEVVYRFPFGRTGPTVNAATPLFVGGRLFVTANYGVGARCVRFTANGVETVWRSDEVLSSQYPTPVCADGYLYGIHGREDVGRAELRCVELATGKVCWSEPDFGMAHLILADRRLLILRVDGKLLLADTATERFRVLSTAEVAAGTTRALPALADGKLYFRTNGLGGGQLHCVSFNR